MQTLAVLPFAQGKLYKVKFSHKLLTVLNEKLKNSLNDLKSEKKNINS